MEASQRSGRASRAWHSRGDGLRDSLENVTAPTFVRISGNVSSDDVVTAPATGLRCALVHWAFFAVRAPTWLERVLGAPRRALRSGLLGANLLVSTRWGIVEAPLEGMSLLFRAPGDAGERVVDIVSEPLASIARELRGSVGSIHLREHSLRRGDPVRIEAWVEPTARATGPYRSGGPAQFVALPALHQVLVYDELVQL